MIHVVHKSAGIPIIMNRAIKRAFLDFGRCSGKAFRIKGIENLPTLLVPHPQWFAI
jgi:hypothetical protein